jgi:hypothetical protein
VGGGEDENKGAENEYSTINKGGRHGGGGAGTRGDGAVTKYDSFSLGGRAGGKEKKGGDETDDAATRKTTAEGRARPRYIAGLLRTAQHWNRDHKVVHKRRVIWEQDADGNPEYEGKETFVMSSYRRKIEEQKHWATEEGERTRRERRPTQNQTLPSPSLSYCMRLIVVWFHRIF